MASAFWSDYTRNGLEPKRKFTFFLELAGVNNQIQVYLINKVTIPSFTVGEAKYSYLNHTFKFPGKVTWNDVTFTVVDAISPNGTGILLDMISQSGYQLPKPPLGADPYQNANTISKAKSIAALGTPIIRHIDHEGTTIDKWTLYGAWVKDVKFGEYSSDTEDLKTIDVTLAYDYASCDSRNGSNAPSLTKP